MISATTPNVTPGRLAAGKQLDGGRVYHRGGERYLRGDPSDHSGGADKVACCDGACECLHATHTRPHIFDRRNVFERLTDVRFYTGTSRYRFDELGNGRGKAGREDLNVKTGWAPCPQRPTEVYSSALRVMRQPVVEPGTLGVQKFGTQAIPPKLIWVYRNGDACHMGTSFFVKACYRNLNQLFRGLTGPIQPIAGPVRRLYDQNLQLVTHMAELLDGGKYLATSGEPPAPLERLRIFLSPYIETEPAA
ncbi:hypothetical protein GNI_013820 [Gregarina niphandrodes]|uniref:Doublecortin domain-containing protein n=1 Tax=Gregarina niphandrodes TaxID=110365 RepID=A0A023BCT2_GRENI|nr:hypothetical protein GNI_013820 [Gregarina niphandrodes]EZG83899.1 hypothetical protein GNI_013820 [Gregarina niphandrodes]|eukprot:XP_011128898.1 hypothetical protein GNI_013820 [Gregarina niphandrodes]